MNVGDYATLASVHHPLQQGRWYSVEVRAVDVTGGVRLSLRINGALPIELTGRGALGAPISQAGQVGSGGRRRIPVPGFSSTQP